MLTKPELYKVLKFFRLFCIVGPFPFQVDLENWELKKPPISKKIICFASYTFFVIHALYKVVSFAYTFLFVQNVPLYQMIIHAIMASSSMVFAFFYYAALIRDPSLFAAYFKATVQGNVGGSGDLRYQPAMERTGGLREYSLQDLIAVTMPYMLLMAVSCIAISYVYDPSMRLLLYASLPGHLQTWATFALCQLEEARLLLTFILLAIPIWQLQVISFDLVSNQLQHLIRLINNGSQTSRSVYMLLRSLQLYISMVNEVNSYMIFGWKLHSIVSAIMSGYAAIAHFKEHPVFGIMYYVLLVNAAFIYTAMYEKAFKIPQLCEEATGCAVLRIRGNRPGVFRRQIRSIPSTGIRVGHFHKMERASTLIFVNFVLTNIVSMLVAYR